MSESEPLERDGGEKIAVALAVAEPSLAAQLRDLLAGLPEAGLVPFADEADVIVTDGKSSADEAAVVVGDAAFLRAALLSGATTVLLLPASRAGLRVAIGAAKNGLLCLPRSLAGALKGPGGAGPDGSFTARERQVLQLLAAGASNKTIARELGISVHTAKFHVASVIAKAGAAGRTEAVSRAIRLGAVHI